jgi:hypothetical protein
MIIVKLKGGLGNQMFQYAIGRRLAEHYHTKLKLDLSLYQDEETDVTPRNFQLNRFFTTAEIARPKDLKLFFTAGSLINKARKFWANSKYIAEQSIRFNPEFLHFGRNCYLDGYWQCESYFSDIKGLIRKEFRLKQSFEGKNRHLANLIGSVNAVSLHIRRGDYVENPVTKQFHGSCSPEYYEKAIHHMGSKINDPHFFVFSDDPAWVANNFRINFPMTIVDNNNESNGFEDMRLMSICKDHIIANSSFSWWGAWLNGREEKIVIGPQKWFNDPSIDTSTVIPETWLKI